MLTPPPTEPRAASTPIPSHVWKHPHYPHLVMRADVREMHGMVDSIEGHLQRIDALLRKAVHRGGGERYGS